MASFAISENFARALLSHEPMGEVFYVENHPNPSPSREKRIVFVSLKNKEAKKVFTKLFEKFYETKYGKQRECRCCCETRMGLRPQYESP